MRRVRTAARGAVVQTPPCPVGCDPVLMLEGPIPATRRLLSHNGLTMSNIDVVEINEACFEVATLLGEGARLRQ